VASTVLIVSVPTVRNWAAITFRTALALYVESSEATITRTVFALSAVRVDSDQLPPHTGIPAKRRPLLHSSPSEISPPGLAAVEALSS